MIYIAKKPTAPNGVVVHTDLAAMLALDGVAAPDLTVSENDFYAAGGLARVINGQIVLGKTEEEESQERKEMRMSEINSSLHSIDSQIGAGRPVRDLLLSYAKNSGIESIAYKNIEEAENQAEKLRNELNEIKEEI
jgi:hypothetical protein